MPSASPARRRRGRRALARHYLGRGSPRKALPNGLRSSVKAVADLAKARGRDGSGLQRSSTRGGSGAAQAESVPESAGERGDSHINVVGEGNADMQLALGDPRKAPQTTAVLLLEPHTSETMTPMPAPRADARPLHDLASERRERERLLAAMASPGTVATLDDVIPGQPRHQPHHPAAVTSPPPLPSEAGSKQQHRHTKRPGYRRAARGSGALAAIELAKRQTVGRQAGSSRQTQRKRLRQRQQRLWPRHRRQAPAAPSLPVGPTADELFSAAYAGFKRSVKLMEDALVAELAELSKSRASAVHLLQLLCGASKLPVLQRPRVAPAVHTAFSNLLQRYACLCVCASVGGCCLAHDVCPPLIRYIAELDGVKQLYEKQKKAPPLARDTPPVSGRIMWARQLLRAVREPMVGSSTPCDSSVLERGCSMQNVTIGCNPRPSPPHFVASGCVPALQARADPWHCRRQGCHSVSQCHWANADGVPAAVACCMVSGR